MAIILKPAIPLRLLALLVTIAGLVFFCSIAFWKLHLPGIYYDEVLHIPPAAMLFDDCSIPAGVYLKFGCVPIILQPPYLGSLKALIHAAIYSFIPVGPISIRLPMLLLFLAAILLFSNFWRKRLPSWLGLALLILLLTDVVSITHARVDWGPYVLSASFKMLAICISVTWIETKDPWKLVLLVLVCAFGIFDKLNFLWVTGAIFIALPLVFWRDTIAGLKALNVRSMLVLGAMGPIGMVWLIAGIIPIVLNNGNGRVFDLARQISHVRALLEGTLNKGAYEFFYRVTWPGPELHIWIFWGSLALGALVFVKMLFDSLTNFSIRESFFAQKYCSYLTIVICILLLSMALTKEVGGSHHIVVLTQLWQLQLILFLSVFVKISLKTSSFRSFFQNFLKFISISVILTLVFANLISGKFWLNAYSENKIGNTNFSPLIYELHKHISHQPGLKVVMVDWGIGTNLIALADNGERKRIKDNWPTFANIGNGIEDPAVVKIILGDSEKALFVLHGEKSTIFPIARNGFFLFLKSNPNCSPKWQYVKNRSGVVHFEIAEVAMSCLKDQE